MSKETLVEAVKNIKLPEHSLRCIFEDYLDFAEASLPERFKSFKERMTSERDFSAKVLENIRAAMLGSSLLLSLDETVDFKHLITSAFPSAALDEDLISMRKELVSRAVSQNKDIPNLAGLTLDTIRKRQKIFFDH